MPASSAYEFRRLARVESISSVPGSSVQGINTHLLEDGAVVWCSETQCDWRFQRGSTAAADNVNVVQPASGPGRFQREYPNSTLGEPFLTQATWYVDSITGNDLNSGVSAGTALKTLAELSRRW